MESIFESNKYFKEALKRVVFRMDEASKRHAEIFGKPWAEKHFTYGNLPHLTKDFKSVLGEKHLTIAASTINDSSAEPLRMNQGFYELDQRMFTYAHAYKMEADYIRNLILRAEVAIGKSESDKVEFIANELFNFMQKAINGVRARNDIMILAPLSNHGKYTFTTENDPSSPYIGLELDYGFDPSKKMAVGAGKEWTEANKATVDPIAEIDSVLKQNRLVRPKKILTDYATLLYMETCEKMKGYLNSTIYPNNPITETSINQWLGAHGMPVIEVVDAECAIQTGDAINPFQAWKTGQLVFIPDDKIGTIETAYSDAELGMKSEGVKYNYYGRIETRTYVQGEKDNANYGEIIKASMTAAPTFDFAMDIITLDTQN